MGLDIFDSAALPFTLTVIMVVVVWPTMLTYRFAERRGRDRTIWTFGAFIASVLPPFITGWIVFAGLMLLPEGGGPNR